MFKITLITSFVLLLMTAVSKNVYFDVLDDTVNKYNKTYHKTIQMKPIDVKSDSYAEYNVDSSDKDPKFQIGDNVRISKYKNIFVKGYAPNWSEKFCYTENKRYCSMELCY